jgi:hypothetical protein
MRYIIQSSIFILLCNSNWLCESRSSFTSHYPVPVHPQFHRHQTNSEQVPQSVPPSTHRRIEDSSPASLSRFQYSSSSLYPSKFGIQYRPTSYESNKTPMPSTFEYPQYIISSRQESSAAEEISITSEKPEKGKEQEEGTSTGMKESPEKKPTPEVKLSPFEEALKNLTRTEVIFPIANEIIFMSIVAAHLPAIVPAILIPLAFYAVGALLIPIVRINYFVNTHLGNKEARRSYGTDWQWNQLLNTAMDLYDYYLL